ncbi:glycoside hydrolase family 28 protein [Pedobacter heparinus]|uniref:Glycoside hydrolase family 28 n=1 Tax=Pedobacter heparinus (strain ATCC 13125 / DSM 2366 / CIP 104194 / JCM 7457 / NBRC 12017 / NCIMB 9290 / NRRL B-14731 / HIM 762-3) TaxID=485917 RepID=C6Y1G3_PEDHD|nr:glycosyl hydrolase family 28 protein [Pedobacter heparinus]ACU02939.1 glycoside hydrolase family 28 [Pedobacter heparinus DSM 2366]
MINQESSDQLSRRAWLGKVSVPALALGGAAMISATMPQEIPKQDIYNIRDYGAKGDGESLDTVAIQAAIDACNAAGGGTVFIPTGVFLSGTLQLKSNVTFHLSAGGKLLGSPKRAHYTAGKGVPAGNGNIVFLYAVNAERLSIEGKGTIDGNGLAFYNGKGDNTGPGQKGIDGNFDRPHLLIFYQCTELRLHDAFLQASAYHCIRLLQCKQVYIDGVRIYNRVNKNNDGFHFSSCQYVHITNCDVQCQDDACALFGSNKFVTITNCSFSTRWSIFRFGGGESQNIAVSNCLIYDTYGCPIKISAGRASIENFSFSNIIMKNVTGPIGIGFSGTPGNIQGGSNQVAGKPFIRNISFNGIRASVVAAPVPHPDIHFELNFKEGERNSCITLNAMDDHYLENISFTDVHVTYAGGGTLAQAGKHDVPKIAAEYFGVWDTAPGGPPAYGLYARNVKGLTLQNVRFEFEHNDSRPAIVFDNVQDAAINGLSLQGSTTAPSLLRIVNSKDLLFTATRVLSPCKVLLSLEGKSNEAITIDGGEFIKAITKVVYSGGANEKSLKLRT